MSERPRTFSRRSFFQGAAASSVAALPLPAASAALPDGVDDALSNAMGSIKLWRSKEGRQLSRCRYHRAEGFFASVEGRYWSDRNLLLYQAGIVIQLGLSSHLLDVGFDDTWCARHLGLDVAKALHCANAAGLDHRVPEIERLATELSPYWKWRPSFDADKPHCSFSNASVCFLTRALLDRVRDVTGHPRPAVTRRA